MATQKRFIAKNGLDNNSQTITNVADPVNSQDVATKNYVSSNFVGSSSSTYPTVRPALNLDFVGTRQLDSRITFVRNSTATYYDGQTTALAEQNLVTYSQDFSNAIWNTTSANVTVVVDNATSPDGSLNADTLTFTGASYRYQNVTTGSVLGKTYTFSVWVSSTSGKDTIGITISGNSTASDRSFLLVNLTSTPTRYSVTRTFTSTDPIIIVGFENRTSIVGGLQTTGDVIVWGAQLEQRSSVTAYTPTTSSAITNYIPVLMTAAANVARLNYNPTTGQPLGLLIEESRTNLLTYSGAVGGTGWYSYKSLVNLNTIISPDGTLTGTKLYSNTDTDAHITYTGNTTFSATAYTVSCYAKKGELNFLYIREQISTGSTSVNSFFNLSTGTLGTIASGRTGTITSIGNGWYRCSITVTAVAGSSGISLGISVSDNTISYTGDGTSGIYIWGAQLEAGSFATSYIPTVASTVTRAADDASMTGTNFSSWYNQSEGTFFVKYIYGKKLANIRVCSVSDGTTSNYIDVIAASGTVPAVTYGAYLYGAINGNAGVFSTSSGSTLINTVDTMRTFAGAYKTNDFKSCNDGGYVGVDTSSSVPVVDRLYFSNNTNSTGALLNGHIKKLSYYPVALSASNLVALTT